MLELLIDYFYSCRVLFASVNVFFIISLQITSGYGNEKDGTVLLSPS